MRVLLLGGTAEARDLARLLVDAEVDVTSSLAGRVARPRLPVGPVRIGGFGGVEGLRTALVGYDVVVDATHPFARGMSANALTACTADAVPLLRFERPGWIPDPAWTYVDSHADAATVASDAGGHVFLTVGRQELARFLPALGQRHVLARVVDEPEIVVPATWSILTSRGPYTLDGDLDLMSVHGIDVLVTKDSGGTYTWSKMQAAARLGARVIVVRRPDPEPGALVVHAVKPALAWVLAQR